MEDNFLVLHGGLHDLKPVHCAVLPQWLCTTITALLHYLFLCVFCWMLAEGIMLYLLVVRVFGKVAQKWYYLLILGWGKYNFVAVSVLSVSATYCTEI